MASWLMLHCLNIGGLLSRALGLTDMAYFLLCVRSMLVQNWHVRLWWQERLKLSNTALNSFDKDVWLIKCIVIIWMWVWLLIEWAFTWTLSHNTVKHINTVYWREIHAPREHYQKQIDHFPGCAESRNKIKSVHVEWILYLLLCSARQHFSS